jgi:hypothetical protein
MHKSNMMAMMTSKRAHANVVKNGQKKARYGSGLNLIPVRK